ncbi:nucleotide sugar dehydrogenase [Streptomyces sp. NPDC003860]
MVGLGYVGLPTALDFTRAGCTVTGLDTSERRLVDLRHAHVDAPPADQRRLRGALASGHLSLTQDAATLSGADAVVICVPTPVDEHRVPDLGPLTGACQTVVSRAVPGQLLLLTSTSYVGSTRDLLVKPLARRGLQAGRDVHVAFAPERIDPGNTRISRSQVPRVVGGTAPESNDRAMELLRLVSPTLHPVAGPEAAEMAKLWENSFRAVNIALANELADHCRALGLSAPAVLSAAATKPYGFLPFRPGPGAGGHCIPCDPHYLLWQLRSLREDSPVLEAAMHAVDQRPRDVTARVRALLADRGTATDGASVLVLGVAYKPGVADVRESPALTVIRELTALGADVSYHDPLVPRLDIDSTILDSVTAPDRTKWDLVLVHTAQSGMDLGWLSTQPTTVLDATYQLPHHFRAAPL